jgi:D,D-heptose 1,7-bisphosphate phosphatase
VNALSPGEYVRHPKDLRLLPGAGAAIRAMNRMGYLVVVITNQGAIAKGNMTKEHVERLHGILIRRLGQKGAKIDAIYYCPHHPQGKVKEHAFLCRCRKPNPGMILDAIKKFRIDRKKSFLIGDATGDILAGKRAKLKTILVKTGYGGRDGKHEARPDATAKNLGAAVKILRKIGK